MTEIIILLIQFILIGTLMGIVLYHIRKGTDRIPDEIIKKLNLKPEIFHERDIWAYCETSTLMEGPTVIIKTLFIAEGKTVFVKHTHIEDPDEVEKLYIEMTDWLQGGFVD